MSVVISLEHVAISGDGPTLTLTLSRGQSLAVVGPSGSGKSRLLNVISGAEKPTRGTIKRHGDVLLAGTEPYSKRTRVQSIAQEDADSDRATEALLATGLWDRRQAQAGELSRSEIAAAQLLPLLAQDHSLGVLDGHLDLLDPWARHRVWQLMRQRSNACFVAVTALPELLYNFDAIVVLKQGMVRFAGSPEELLRQTVSHQVTLETMESKGVRALVEPFKVSIESDGSSHTLKAAEGQELAARLLLEGYGDVRFVVSRPPSMAEALEYL